VAIGLIAVDVLQDAPDLLNLALTAIRLQRFVDLLAEAGRADELVSPLDKKVGIGFAAATILIVVASMSAANSKYPITIPLQAVTMRGMVPLEDKKSTIAVKVEEATYRVPGRAMRMKLTITNNGSSAVRLGEFYTASVRFLDSSVYKDTTGYPEDLLAEDGLTVTDNGIVVIAKGDGLEHMGG